MEDFTADPAEIGRHKLEGVDEAKVWETVRAVVDEAPDSRYLPPLEGGGCYYVHPPQFDPGVELGDETGRAPQGPGCIIGTVLHRLGADLEKLRGYEHQSAYIPLSAFVPDLSRGSREALTALQRRQDDKWAWGDALNDVEENFPNVAARPAA